MSKLYQLTEKHPTMQALVEVFELMEDKGIRIDVSDNILTVEHAGNVYRLLDLEQSYFASSYSGIFTFPPACEYKLCYEKVPQDEPEQQEPS